MGGIRVPARVPGLGQQAARIKAAGRRKAGAGRWPETVAVEGAASPGEPMLSSGLARLPGRHRASHHAAARAEAPRRPGSPDGYALAYRPNARGHGSAIASFADSRHPPGRARDRGGRDRDVRHGRPAPWRRSVPGPKAGARRWPARRSEIVSSRAYCVRAERPRQS